MTELGATQSPAILAAAPASIANPLLDGPILRTLVALATPNVVALTVGVCVTIAETSYIGRLGTEPLAAMALVFPFVILTMTMSGGAMGGGVASAIARALGAGDVDRASALALHALLIGLSFGLVFTIVMLGFGRPLLELLGGRGHVLDEAVAYVEVYFGGAAILWLMNTLNSILRGTGNMRLPSALVLLAAAIQIMVGGALGLGVGPIPQLGMRGVACGSLIAFGTGAAIGFWYLFVGLGRVNLSATPLRVHASMFFDILKVGAVACLSPLQSVLAVTIFAHMLARFGTEVLAGYGIGARLEFMLTSIAFAVGIGSVPMVGMAVGAGRIRRARRVAWTAGLVSFAAIAAFGVVLAIWPRSWIDLFTADPGVIDAGTRYLRIAAPFNAFIGLGIALYFAAQGAARIVGPVLAQTVRLVFVAAGGAVLVATEAGATSFYALAAASMAILGLGCAAVVKFTPWGTAASPTGIMLHR